MKKYLLLIFIGFILVANSQQEKSVSLKPTEKTQSKGITRALIVGVSEYQQIHGLQYADKDAEEFGNFLLSNPNWKLSPENLILLTNAKAKSGNIITWLNWLLDNSKDGDNVIFYFSGHGDVETTADISKGFLLTYDCPKNNYITGALGVDLLQQVFSEMLNKGIKVYIVTDACRSGHYQNKYYHKTRLEIGTFGIIRTRSIIESIRKMKQKYCLPNQMKFRLRGHNGAMVVESFLSF